MMGRGTAIRLAEVAWPHLILDAFVGSGTALIAAESVPDARRWIGIDCGKYAIYAAQVRLLRQENGRAPFTLFNAGLYEVARAFLPSEFMKRPSVR